jgi:PII-like signaling protein
MTIEKTESELIQEAWEVQNACNLSGVVHSFSAAISRLWTIYQTENKKFSTTDIAEHIVSKLYASKIMSLSGDLPIDLSSYGIKY